MQDDQRGKINNRARIKQICNFSGLKFGSMTPTDIDGFLECHNAGYIFIELKYRDAPLPQGQRLALERLCDDVKGKPAVALIASHNNNPEEDIMVARAIVKEFRWSGRWHERNQTVKDFIDAFIKYVDEKNPSHDNPTR